MSAVKVATFLERAQECLRLADLATDPDMARQWGELAKAYQQAAVIETVETPAPPDDAPDVKNHSP